MAAAVKTGWAAPAGGGGAKIRFGYAAITWGNEEKQAVDDISATGYQGVQFRANALTEFKPAELKSLMQAHKLTFVALSSGQIDLEAPLEPQLAEHTKNAEYVRDAGGRYLQILDKLTSYTREVTPEECRKLGSALTELGKRTAAVGIPLGYHNHLNTIGQKPENLARVMEASDPKYVKLELDTAHCQAGGGDPAAAVEKYRDRLLFMHLKDVVDAPASGGGARYPFKFVELGKGMVNFPAVFAALNKIRFDGWAVVELDHVTSPTTSAKESAEISRQYLEKTIGVKV